MVFETIHFDRLFSVARDMRGQAAFKITHFGFESRGKRFFSVTVPGWPRVEEGMTVIALLKRPNDWGDKSLLGWVDCSDGTLVCYGPMLNLGVFAVLSFFLPLFWVSDVKNPWVADLIVAVVFGGGALISLYAFVKHLLVKRALLQIAHSIKIPQVSLENIAVEGATSPERGSRHSPYT
jgi:hypothetical protein